MAKYIITNRKHRNKSVGMCGTHLKFDEKGQCATESKAMADFIAQNYGHLGYTVADEEEAKKQALEDEAKAAELAEFKKTLTPAMRGKLSKQLREWKAAWDATEDPDKRSEITEKIKDLEAKLA